MTHNCDIFAIYIMRKENCTMKKCFICALLIVAVALSAASGALAERARISLGGKLGLMYEGTEVTLRPNLKGVRAESLRWESSDAAVAEVDAGRISARAAGRAVISVSAAGASARCGVVVLPRSVTLAVGETLALPNGTLERYAVKDGSVAAVSRRGVIGGKKAGETLVGVRYGKQTLFVEVKVVGTTQGEGAGMEQSAAAELDCANSARQIVLVEHEGGSRARLSIHENKDGAWKELYSCTAYVGKNGIGKEKEGDGKTPSGTYNLTQPFGIKADPGAKQDYTQVTKDHYWCGTSGSAYYNQMVDMRVTDRMVTSSDEYLINYGSVYNYCMFIDYNASGAPGRGSCIFLHCTGSAKSTAGCIAVPEKVMQRIVQWAGPGTKIVIR